MAVRVGSAAVEADDRFAGSPAAAPPAVNRSPTVPPTAEEKTSGGDASPSEASPPPRECAKQGESASESSCDETGKSKSLSPNGVPAKFPSPRSWNSSPNKKESPSVSPESSRSCPPAGAAASPEGRRKSPQSEASALFESHPSETFKMSNSFVADSYLRLNPLNPFQPIHNFLGGPFLASADPKTFIGEANFGLVSQQLHQINGLSKPQDLNDLPMTIQQLHFLQSKLQGLPVCSTLPFSKFPDSKAQLSVLINARKSHEGPLSNGGPNAIESGANHQKYVGSESGSRKDHRNRQNAEDSTKSRRMSVDEDANRTNFGDESDSDELLSVGSESPPPNCHVTLFRRDTDNESDAGSSSLDCSSSLYGKTGSLMNRGSKIYDKKYLTSERLQNNLTNSKTLSESNRTLKFSIDNILKSDFGNDNVVGSARKQGRGEEKSKKQDMERGPSAYKKKTGEDKEVPVDLSQENAANVSGTEAPMLWPAWVYCTRYSDRPSSGPRTRRSKNKDKNPEEKRPRTAFSGDQLSRLKHEFAENRYLTERRRQDLARELGLNEAQIKIWFQNKRAKMKKARGEKNPLALQLMAQGLYNHSTVPLTKEEEEAAAAELSD